MTSLEEIQIYLNIDIDEPLRDGLKNPQKNKYYYYHDQYYIVELSQNRWTILEDCAKTRTLLKDYVWCALPNYTATNIGGTTKYYHQMSQNYTIGVADHINGRKYDNRFQNIRICSQRENTRNRRLSINNTSQKGGVSIRRDKKGKCYWRMSITDNDNVRIDKYYSVDIYGYEQSKEMAINERKRLEVMYGYIGE